MDLCRLYILFSGPFWLVFWGIYLFGTIIDLFSFLKNRKEPYFLDAICLTFDTSKAKAICVCIVSIIMCLMVFFGSRQIVIGLGCDDIQVMTEGTYCYYVYATNEKDKTYTLPANIEKVNDNEYLVHNVYFKNGGFLYFEDCDYFDYGDKEYSIDQNGNGWYIELTPRKAYHERVEETEPSNPLGLIFPSAVIAIILFSTILYIKRIRKEDI